MRLFGVLVVLAGWVITVGGLLTTSSTMARAIIACVGIGVSIYGILGVLNKYYLARAVWKK